MEPTVRVLHLASDLGPNATAKQLSLIAPALAAAYPVTQQVLCWGQSSPFETPLLAAGVPVNRVGFDRRYHLPGWRELLRSIREFAPTLIHLWGGEAYRFWPLVRLKLLGANLGKLPVVANYQRDDSDYSSLITHRVMRQLNHIFLAHEHELPTVAALGVDLARTSVVPMSVGTVPPPTLSRDQLRAKHGLPHDALVILHASNLDERGGARRSVWSFDVLKHTSPHWRLVVVGTGSHEERVKSFNAKLAYDDQRVTFLPYQSKLWELFPMVDFLWLTHERGGENLALEAMSQGVPVFAFRNADLSELITTQENGFLVPPEQPPQLGVETNDFRIDPSLITRFAKAGYATIATRTPAIAAASFWQEYSRLNASQSALKRSQ